MPLEKEGVMIILSSPSGAGKTTLVKMLSRLDNYEISVSHTTRLPRSNEIDGVDYHFVSHKKFEELIKKKLFYEHAKIFENYYGTLKKNVDETILHNDIIFDIDWQGTKQLSKFTNLNLIKIFLITDNKDELKKRLIKRNQNTKEEVEKRFNSFNNDVKHWNDYDYIIINKNLEVCFKQIENIILNNKNKIINSLHTIQ